MAVCSSFVHFLRLSCCCFSLFRKCRNICKYYIVAFRDLWTAPHAHEYSSVLLFVFDHARMSVCVWFASIVCFCVLLISHACCLLPTACFLHISRHNQNDMQIIKLTPCFSLMYLCVWLTLKNTNIVRYILCVPASEWPLRKSIGELSIYCFGHILDCWMPTAFIIMRMTSCQHLNGKKCWKSNFCIF